MERQTGKSAGMNRISSHLNVELHDVKVGHPARLRWMAKQTSYSVGPEQGAIAWNFWSPRPATPSRFRRSFCSVRSPDDESRLHCIQSQRSALNRFTAKCPSVGTDCSCTE